MVEFHWHHGPLIYYTLDVKMDTQPYTYTCIIVPNTAYVVKDLDHTLSYAFKWLSAPEGIINPQQRSMIAMFIL